MNYSMQESLNYGSATLPRNRTCSGNGPTSSGKHGSTTCMVEWNPLTKGMWRWKIENEKKRTATQLSVRCCYHGIALAYRGMFFFFFFFFWGEGSRPRCLADLKARALRVEGSCFPVCILLIMLSHLFFLFLVTSFFSFFFSLPPPLLFSFKQRNGYCAPSWIYITACIWQWRQW